MRSVRCHRQSGNSFRSAGFQSSSVRTTTRRRTAVVRRGRASTVIGRTSGVARGRRTIAVVVIGRRDISSGEGRSIRRIVGAAINMGRRRDGRDITGRDGAGYGCRCRLDNPVVWSVNDGSLRDCRCLPRPIDDDHTTDNHQNEDNKKCFQEIGFLLKLMFD
ncbi:hypothetical protein SmphiM12_276 [Sinorhizobium phage phiM12]|uniref:Uncharacterized protein n=1 Tax=Sinorhizobium phage phiM12 TaxID=1357423 RepID=S5MBA9_9CAUD|nr:hypothetical protein AB690_gp300 [Sinorhizobium phage phiM12]AGR47908.1 hypothetical protein SmphiM12_276 [Sinorhizobium phage phiM12]